MTGEEIFGRARIITQRNMHTFKRQRMKSDKYFVKFRVGIPAFEFFLASFIFNLINLNVIFRQLVPKLNGPVQIRVVRIIKIYIPVYSHFIHYQKQVQAGISFFLNIRIKAFQRSEIFL